MRPLAKRTLIGTPRAQRQLGTLGALPSVDQLGVGLVGPWTWLVGFVDLVVSLRVGGPPLGAGKGAGLFGQALKGGDGLVV